jgi:hypothetical protein
MMIRNGGSVLSNIKLEPQWPPGARWRGYSGLDPATWTGEPQKRLRSFYARLSHILPDPDQAMVQAGRLNAAGHLRSARPAA